MEPSWRHAKIEENQRRREGFKFLRKLGKIRLNTDSKVIEEEEEDESPNIAEP